MVNKSGCLEGIVFLVFSWGWVRAPPTIGKTWFFFHMLDLEITPVVGDLDCFLRAYLHYIKSVYLDSEVKCQNSIKVLREYTNLWKLKRKYTYIFRKFIWMQIDFWSEHCLSTSTILYHYWALKNNHRPSKTTRKPALTKVLFKCISVLLLETEGRYRQYSFARFEQKALVALVMFPWISLKRLLSFLLLISTY